MPMTVTTCQLLTSAAERHSLLSCDANPPHKTILMVIFVVVDAFCAGLPGLLLGIDGD